MLVFRVHVAVLVSMFETFAVAAVFPASQFFGDFFPVAFSRFSAAAPTPGRFTAGAALAADGSSRAIRELVRNAGSGPRTPAEPVVGTKAANKGVSEAEVEGSVHQRSCGNKHVTLR